MKLLLSIGLLALAVTLAGCDVDVDSRTSTPASPAVPADGTNIDVDIDAPDKPAENRTELRQQRRENIREAIDGVDVNVGNGGVDVDVD